MDPTWFNRIGIILDLLAGFMIAPELIGEERLQRWEGRIEQFAVHTRESITRLAPMSGHRGKSSRKREYSQESIRFMAHALFLATLVYAWIIYHWIATNRPSWALLGTGFWAHLIFAVGWVFTLRMIIVLAKIWHPIYSLMYPLGLPQFFVARLILWLIAGLLGRIVKALIGNARLQSILFSWGVIFFILGNLLQLWATY